jgi:MFS family permease
MMNSMTLSAARSRTPLLSLYGTTLVSVTGDAMAAIAIPWFVLQTTGSATQTGITAFFSIAPIVIGMFFGGTLVDRIGYKRVSVVADIASGLTMALIPLLHYTIGLAFWQLLALVFIGNLMDAPGRSAKDAMLPELTDAAGLKIDQTSAWMSSVSRATAMIGGPVAGLLIALVGAPGVLVINAATFFVSAIGIQIFIPTALVEPEAKPKTNYWNDLREGFRYVRDDRLILTFIIVIMITNMIDTAMASVTMPLYALSVYGVENGSLNLGLLVGTFGGAAVVGTLLYSFIGRRFQRRWVLILGFIQVGFRFIFYAAFPPFAALLAAIALGGILAGPINPVIDSVMYERTPRAMRARVFGLLSAGVLAAMPFGGLMAGVLQETLGLYKTLLLYALIYLVTTGSLLIIPAVRLMDEKPKAEVDQEAVQAL